MLSEVKTKQKLVFSTEKTLFLKIKKGIVGIRVYKSSNDDFLINIIPQLVSNRIKFSIVYFQKELFLRIFIKGTSIDEITTILDGIEFMHSEMGKNRVTGYEVEFNFLTLFVQSVLENKEEWAFSKNGLNEKLYVAVWSVSLDTLILLLDKLNFKSTDFFFSVSILPNKNKNVSVSTLFSIISKENEKVKFLSLFKKAKKFFLEQDVKTVRALFPSKFMKWRVNLATGFFKEYGSELNIEKIKLLLKKASSVLAEEQSPINKNQPIYYPPDSIDYVLPLNSNNSHNNRKSGDPSNSSPLDLGSIPRPSHQPSGSLTLQQSPRKLEFDNENIRKIKDLILNRGFEIIDYSTSYSLFIIKKRGITFVIYYYENLNEFLLTELITDFDFLRKKFGPKLRALLLTKDYNKSNLSLLLPNDFEIIRLTELY